MDLADVLTALLRRWVVLLLVTVPIVLGATWYAQRAPAVYEATSVVGFQPRPDAQIGADVVRLILPQYTAILGAPATVEELARTLDLSPEVIADALTVAIPPETSTLEVTATDPDPAIAAEIANAASGAALAASRNDSLLEAERIVTAVAPREPSGPARRLLIAAGAVVALFAGVAAALSLERLHPSARTTPEVEEALGVPVLASLPPILSARPVTGLMAEPAFSGAVRLLRTSLGQLERSEGVRVIGVASVRGGAAPATVACALAISLAAVHAKVLLIDADMGAPLVSKRLGIPAGPGLPAVLRGEASIEEVARPAGVDGLEVIAGAPDSGAVDHFALAFPALRRGAQGAYDFVVIAAPDLLGGSVAPLVTALVDGVLLVVERGSSVRQLREGLRVLDLVNAKTLGAVTVA